MSANSNKRSAYMRRRSSEADVEETTEAAQREQQRYLETKMNEIDSRSIVHPPVEMLEKEKKDQKLSSNQ